MDDYLYRRRPVLSPYLAYASQVMQHPHSTRSSQYFTGLPYHGLQPNQMLLQGTLMDGFGTRLHSSPGLMANVPLLADGNRSRRVRNADGWEGPRKKLRKEDGKKSREKMSEDDMAKEVAMLHSLWESGGADSSEDVKDSSPESEQQWKPNRKTQQRNKRKAKYYSFLNETSTASSWGALSDHHLDQNNSSWGQLPIKDGKDEKSKSSDQGNNSWEQLPLKDCKDEKVESSEQGKSLKHSFAREQKAALKIVTEFLGHESDVEDSDEDTDEELDYPDAVVQTNEALEIAAQTPIQGREERAFSFFLRLFDENKGIRKAYEECCNVGTFECLVCASMGSNRGKKFPDLVGLVQHARKVLRTKRKSEHRGYGRAICSLLGWDPSRDPVLPRAVSGRPRGFIPPSEETLQEHAENDTEKIESAEEKSEVEDENKTDDITCRTTAVHELCVQRSGATMHEDGKDMENDVIVDGEGKKPWQADVILADGDKKLDNASN